MTHHGLCLFQLLTSVKEEQAFRNNLKPAMKLVPVEEILQLKCTSYIAGPGRQKCHMQADDASDLLIDLVIDQASKQGQVIVK